MNLLRTLHARLGPGWMLVLGFVILFSIYEGGRILHTRPNSFHLWRQTDCLSITANYQAGRNFLEPEIHARIADGGESGDSAGEFPIIYWLMGQVWKIMGQSEFAYRLFGALLHLLATWCLFHALRRVLASSFWALCTALLLFTSPVLVYYSIGFLTDVPAFDLVLIGWYFVVRHAQEQQRRWWVWAIACFALATLLKVSAGMSLVALMALLLVATLWPRSFGEHGKLLPPIRSGWAAVAAALLAILAWYVYAEHYNRQHNGRYTFNSVWPIWEMTPEAADRAWTFARQILVFQVFDTTVWLALGVAFSALVVNVRRIPFPAALLNGLLLVGVVVYTLLWFNALEGHDYYFINPMIALVVLWTTWLWWLRRDHPDLFHARWMKVAMATLLLFNVAYAANNMQMRYTVFEPIDPSRILPIYHEHELPFWSADDYYGLRSTLDMRPALDSLAVGKDDVVIYLDDISINGSLYLMGRKGFTNYGHDWSDPATFERLKELGAQYLIFAEDRWLEDPVVKPLLKRLVGRHRWAYIFDIMELPELEETVVVLRAGSVPLALVHRFDTVPCGPGEKGWCFKATEYPLEIDALPTYGADVSRAKVRIRGHLHAEALVGDELAFMLGEDDDKGQVGIKGGPLNVGPFEVAIDVHRRPPQVRNKLFLWNRTGRPIVIEGMEVSVLQYQRVD